MKVLIIAGMGTTRNWARFARWNVARVEHRTVRELKHRTAQNLKVNFRKG